jgi:hypothetical protein
MASRYLLASQLSHFQHSVKSSFNSTSALARSIESAVVSIHPAPISSPVRTFQNSIRTQERAASLRRKKEASKSYER